MQKQKQKVVEDKTFGMKKASAEQLTAIMASDMAKIGKLIRDKGIRAE